MSSARVTFDLRRGTILVEGSADDLTKLFEAARAVAPALKEIHIMTDGTPAAGHAAPSKRTDDVPRAPPQRAPTLREFAQRFADENLSCRIAALAYYSTEYARKPSFSAREMLAWFEQCGFTKPAQMAVAMSDARRKYHYVESRGRDRWTLAPQGREQVLAILAEGPAS